MKLKQSSASVNPNLIRTFNDEVILYDELYNLDQIKSELKVTKEYFRYCLTRENFIILLIYDQQGQVYLKECGVNQFTLLGGKVLKNEDVRGAVQRIISQSFKQAFIEDLEPMAISKNMFVCENDILEHTGLVMMARIETNSHCDFYHLTEAILNQCNRFSDQTILKLFKKRFNNMVLLNNSNFQDDEIEVNKKYKLRYELHNNIVKKYILTSKMKQKQKLIKIMSEKARGCSKFLDVSCGDNSLLFSLDYDENFEYIVANDISWSQIELIPKRKDVFFTNHNAITFAFKDNIFDFVYCSNTLHHMPDEESLINLLKSMLRVGKKIVIFEIEDPEIIGGFPYYLNKYWYRGFLKDAGEKYLSYNDFKKIITQVFHGKASVKFSCFKNIQGNYMIAEINKIM